ncbi:uncharacterized protein LOC129758294 [Uranotaenia lowii]|uniref:uncharacterized protein LOC129758294 n=1 Tax=Uranotaenia lowii TaxID=190385 RepID=UPI00247A1525|nr:uncharacterized protein LOC129758294 [Uranotaenia lowii]
MTRSRSTVFAATLLVLLTVCLQFTFISANRKAVVVQPAHTRPHGKPGPIPTASAGQPDPVAAQKLAQEINSKANAKKSEGALDVLHALLKSNNATNDEKVQLVRESVMFNALHEAIDEKIVESSFIQTLASVGEAPLINDYRRDTLLIKSIKEDVNFTFGEGVFAWKTLTLKSHDQHVIVGLSKSGIIILSEHFGEYKLQQEIAMETVPTAFEVITVWDTVEDAAVSCLIVSTELALVWYSLRPAANYQLAEEWRWPLHKTTTLIKWLKHKDIDMLLLVGTHPNKQKSVSATLYEFSFERHQFWLMQMLPLDFPCRTIGLVNDGNEFLVAFPQNDTAMIYSLEVGAKYRGKFTQLANFTSEQINSVGAFQIGRYSYVAIGGKSPQILRYSNGNFTSQNVSTNALETVEAFFEIPTRTYRDDLILLVQHKMRFSTHELHRLDTLVWNGESFDIRSNIPCYVEDEIIDYEVSCMLDLHRPTGIVGSTIVQRGKHVSMIVPRYQAHSSLYHLKVEMLSGEHPITQKIQEIRETIEAFTKIVEYQDTIIHQALDLVDETKSLNQPFLDLKNCSVKEVYTEITYLHPNFNLGPITIGNVTWTPEDTHVDAPAMARDIELELHALGELEHQLQYAIRNDNDSFSLDLDKPLHIEGQVQIDGSLVTDDLYVRKLEEEPFTIRLPREAERLKELHLKHLKVRHLKFNLVNGIPASELVFNTGDKVVLNETLIVENSFVAQNVVLPKGGVVNGRDLSESTIYFNCDNRRWKNLHFDHLEAVEDVLVKNSTNGIRLDMDALNTKFRNLDQASNPSTRKDTINAQHLHLDGSLYVQNVNGVSWNEFIQKIVLKHRPNRLPELRINGNLILEHPNTTVFHLNELAFPGDFLLSSSPREAVVTGHKRFLNVTHINIMDIETTVNGIDLRDIITLDDDQHIPGNVTFADLHVAERLEIRGAVRGPHLDAFLDNPSLLQTKLVKAACHFRELHVDGPVIVQNRFAGMDVDATLGDVVYDTEHNVEIVSGKRIGTAEFLGKVTVSSNMINEFRLDDFVTRSTEQELPVQEIEGDVFFENLSLGGLFDGLNVTEVDYSSIKLYGDQYTEASLIFQNPRDFGYPDIEANEVRILKTLNNKRRSEFLDTEQGDLVLSGEITVDKLKVEQLQMVKSSLDGPSKMINDVHLPTFDELRFSLSRPQKISAPFFVDKLVVGSQLTTPFVNGRDFRSLKQDLDKVENIKNHLLQGSIPVENLYISGNLQVNMVNDVHFDSLLKDVIWLDRPNRIPGSITFLDPLIVQGNLTTQGLINGIDFGEYVRDVARKSDGVVQLESTKIFTNGLVVEGNADTESINNIFVKDLALKNQTVYLSGEVEVAGNLYVNDLILEGYLNGEPIQNFLEQYHYDEHRDVHVIRGDLFFNKVAVQSMNVRGSWNQLSNLDAYLGSLIRKNQNYNFTKPITFRGPVVLEQGAQIDHLNGVDISNIASDIVRINEETPVQLMGAVSFDQHVHFGSIEMQGDLITPNIAGCSPNLWIQNSIMVNQDAEITGPVVFAPGALELNDLQASLINGYPMEQLISLSSNQTIQGELFFDEVTITKPLEVGGLINGFNFGYERQNTLMTYGTQHIRTPSIFNSIKVLDSLMLPPVLNGKLLGIPVLRGPKMVITSPISFRNVIATSLQTKDSISGINFDWWYENSLWSRGRDHQEIESKVRARNVRFDQDVEGNGMINGVDIKDVIHRMRAAKRNVELRLSDFRSEYRALCSSTRGLVQETQRRTFFFKYFVQRQVINEHLDIDSFHFFNHLGYYFLAVNYGCSTNFYQWDTIGKLFLPLFQFHTGVVEEWKSIVDGDRAVYLVTKSPSEVTDCQIVGVTVWLFTGVQLRKLWNAASADVADAIHTEVTKPESFYISKDGLVMEYNIDGNVLEQWELPKSLDGYRFIPNEVGLGLALTDGKLVVLLSNVNKAENLPRTRRSTNETLGMALFNSQSVYDRMSNKSMVAMSPKSRAWQMTDSIEPEVVNANEDIDSRSRSLPLRSLATEDLLEDEDSLVEETIARDIPLGGILTADIPHFPGRSRGEILTFSVGSPKRKHQLTAVTFLTSTVIKGDHDAIKIYLDIQMGDLYQVLPCYRPSHLTALELRDETVLAFLESRHTVQIYIYRGLKGFVRSQSFHLAAPAIQMGAVALPQKSLLRCKIHYLAIATAKQELVLLRAKTQGDCGLIAEVDCDLE